MERAIELAHEHHQLVPLAVAHSYLVTFSEVTGETRSAPEHGRQSVDAAEKTGVLSARVAAYYGLGLAHLVNDEWTAAVSALEGALAIAHAGRCWEAGILARLAWGYLGLGDHDRARKAAEEALTMVERHGTKLWKHHAQLVLARILMETGGAGAAATVEAALRAAEASIEAIGAKSYQPFVHLGRAVLARLLGDAGTRQNELRESQRLFVEIGAPIRAARVAEALAS